MKNIPSMHKIKLSDRNNRTFPRIMNLIYMTYTFEIFFGYIKMVGYAFMGVVGVIDIFFQKVM